MVCASPLTVKLCWTGVAAAKLVLPHWVAVIPQVPPLSKVTVFAETVQTAGVVEAKMTGRPEEAVAVKLNGAEPKVAAGRAAKLMVCVSPLTVKLCCTGVAAA
jgi:hypothetical protein